MVSFDLLTALANTSATLLDSDELISNTRIAVVTRSTDVLISDRVPVARSDTAAIVSIDSLADKPDCPNVFIPSATSVAENFVLLATSLMVSPICTTCLSVAPVIACKSFNAWSNSTTAVTPVLNPPTKPAINVAAVA